MSRLFNIREFGDENSFFMQPGALPMLKDQVYNIQKILTS